QLILFPDLNGDGLLDLNEVGALFNAELAVIYNKTNPNFDPFEADEERARMMEHFMSEYDIDKNNVISKEEFLSAFKKAEYQDNQGWDPIDSSKEGGDSKSFEQRKQKISTASHPSVKVMKI
ncbi:hypothetical protein GJ496_002615, partial [Pomphorhynchus laevis]